MTNWYRRVLTCFALIGATSSAQIAFAQAWKESVGYNQLVAQQGGSLEDGSGLRVAMPEAPSGGRYLPDANSSQFTGKTITDGTGTNSSPSSHASNVAFNFFGNTLSMTGGITDITGFDANDYVDRVMGAGTGADPLPIGFDITNHSYIGNGIPEAEKVDLLLRFDYLINRDNTVAVVGTNNGSGNTTPDVWAPSYNAITVGRSDGNHARGLTTEYGLGRLKPDIVAPAGTVSDATPIVSSAAALLRDAGSATNAIHNEVTKALLFAGATKAEFPDWDRTTTRPIDEVYGHGELNIYNSYQMLVGGEFEGDTSNPATDVAHAGFDYGQFNGTDDLYYDFELTNDGTLSASLVWNAVVTDSGVGEGSFIPTLSIANLDLELFDSSGTFLGSLVDASVSTEYNTEHIYQTGLAAGNYTFRVGGDMAADFGFAWQIVQVPEPSGVLALGLMGALALIRRRRCR